MDGFRSWLKEASPRLSGSTALDRAKVQSPCVVRLPGGGYRLFYTAVGPGKPYPECQGYILSARSPDGLRFEKEPGIRVAPRRDTPNMSLRVLSPAVAACADGTWRMYFEARGTADVPTVIRSATSSDLLRWTIEDGVRFHGPGGVGGVRHVALPDGRARIYCLESLYDPGGLAAGRRVSQRIVSAISVDGLRFEREPGVRMTDRQSTFDTAGITTAEVLPPRGADQPWTMLFSAWQLPASGTAAPLHPSLDADAIANGNSADFAAVSIASDMSGYRSRIFRAESHDGLSWGPGELVLEGDGYGGVEVDAVHAEDMSVIEYAPGCHRMYYAACDAHGRWCVASAIRRATARIG